MKLNKMAAGLLTPLAAFIVIFAMAVQDENSYIQPENVTAEYQPFSFDGTRQLTLYDQDNLGRATGAHIQLKDSDEPESGSREGGLSDCDPVGWNQTMVNGAYFWDRGHLIGYQFSGLMCTDPDTDIRNYVPEPHWFNAGDAVGFDAGNKESMVYYENKLDSWLSNNKDDYLDYQVNPWYNDNDLIPEYIILNYTGFDSQGNQIDVPIEGVEPENKISTVVLENKGQPGTKIDYTTGDVTDD